MFYFVRSGEVLMRIVKGLQETGPGAVVSDMKNDFA